VDLAADVVRQARDFLAAEFDSAENDFRHTAAETICVAILFAVASARARGHADDRALRDGRRPSKAAPITDGKMMDKRN